MDNDIDTNEYYILYHVKGWFDCCFWTPRVKIPKEMGRAVLEGNEDVPVIQSIIKEAHVGDRDWAQVNPCDIEILEMEVITNGN